MNRPYFMSICGRHFNLEYVVSIEICESASPGHAVCTVEYQDKSITYPITGSVKENREKLKWAWCDFQNHDGIMISYTGIERR